MFAPILHRRFFSSPGRPGAPRGLYNHIVDAYPGPGTIQLETDYILIDYENVQPKNLGILADHPFKTIVFVGAQQSKLQTDLVIDIQKLGSKAEYIKIGGHGRNALDFHIAFYIGRLSAENEAGRFHIISKDNGFDPLIRHLRDRKILVQREPDLSEIPALRISKAIPAENKVEVVKMSLAARGQSRPRKLSTLKNTIQSLFKETLQEAELTEIVDALLKRGFIVVNQNNRIGYKLR